MKRKLNVFDAVDFVNGDIAKEAAHQAERQFIENDFEKEEEYSFTEMAYKDDDGYWRITGVDKKFDSYEELSNHLGYEP